MKALLTNLGMLLGILLAVAGVVAVLVTGFDPLFAGLGVLTGAAGGGLAYSCNKASGGVKSTQGDMERSRQAPPAAAKSRSKVMHKRL